MTCLPEGRIFLGGKNTVFEEFRSFGVNFFRFFETFFGGNFQKQNRSKDCRFQKTIFMSFCIFFSLFFFRINLRCYVVNLWIMRCQVHLVKQGILTETEGSVQLTSLYELVEI